MRSGTRRRLGQRASRTLAEALERRVLFAAGTADLTLLTSPTIPSGSLPDDRPVDQPLSTGADASEPPALYALTVPALSSLPGATAKIFLNFLGDTVPTWGPSYHPGTFGPYDIDGNEGSFSGQELANINEIWARVAECYSPFNINVTTVDPGTYPAGEVVKVEMDGSGADWLGAEAGGVAFGGGFTVGGPNRYNYVFVFPDNLGNGHPKSMAQAIAHEVGHAFGLRHQSTYNGTTLDEEYNPGDVDVAPIMGVSYYSTRGLWWSGPTPQSSTSIQNDMSVLSNALNGFGYRADDAGNAAAAARALGVTNNVVSASGIIERVTDVDYYAFHAEPGPINLTVSVAPHGPMLDAAAELRDADGNVLVSRDTVSFGESLAYTATSAGTYYLVIRGDGTYGDVGQYTISGTVVGEQVQADAGGPYAVAEGGQVTLSAAGSRGRIATYEWDMDYDGVTFQASLTGASPRFSAINVDGPATRAVGLRVTDTGGNVSVATAVLTVTNTAPSARLVATAATEAGTTTVVRFQTPADPSPQDTAAGFLYSYDFDNDGAFDVVDSPSATATVPAAYLPDGPASVVVRGRIADKDGDYAEYTTTVNVTNVAPTATFSAGAGAFEEGAVVPITFADVRDSAADVAGGFRYSFDLNGDRVYEVVDAAEPTHAYVFPDNGTYVVRGRVKDKDGGVSEYVTTVVVTSVAPTATVAVTAGAEGSAATVEIVGAADASAADTAAGFWYGFDLNDDGTFDVVKSLSAAFTFVPPDDGAYLVRARVWDKDGAYRDYPVTVTVANATPAATLTGGTVTEGSAGTVVFAGLRDSAADAAAGFRYSYDFDDDGVFEVSDSADATTVVPASFLADGPFVRTVRGRVTDKDGGWAEYTATVDVLNAPPTILMPMSANQHVVLKTSLRLSVAASDAGPDTVSRWRVEWGDGETTTTPDTSAVLDHTYAAVGEYVATVTATDEDGTYAVTRAVSVTKRVPTAALATGGLTAGAAAYRFGVTYEDDLGIDAATLGDADVWVVGPGGWQGGSVRLVSTAPRADGPGVVATYEAAGPAGGWGWQDAGEYTVWVGAGQVVDLHGDAVPLTDVGAFAVDLVAPDTADLIGEVVAMPRFMVPGGRYRAGVRVISHGTRNLPAANVTTALYLSADGVLDTGDVRLGTATRRLALAINDSRVVSFSFATPDVPADGRYRLLARVDAADAVAERDERNNVSASAPLPVRAPVVDLSLKLASALRPAYRPGDTVTAPLRLTNAGNRDANGSVGLRMVFSRDAILDDQDLNLVTETVPLRLRAGAAKALNLSATLPASLAGGPGYLFAVVTGAGVGDRDVANNTTEASEAAIRA